MATTQKPTLTIVSTDLPEPPYPADTKSNGYRQEVDWQRIKASKTWKLCPPERRNTLLRVWLESWNEVPAGSWEDDDELIAVSVDEDPDIFSAFRRYFLRGWTRHSDGRLYHPYITEQVLKMLAKRKTTTRRVRKFREQEKKVTSTSRDNDESMTYKPCNALPTRYQRVGNAAETGNRKQEQEQEQEEYSALSSVSSINTLDAPKKLSPAKPKPGPIPQDWQPNAKNRDWLKSRGATGADAERIVSGFINYFSQAGIKKINWDLAFARNPVVAGELAKLKINGDRPRVSQQDIRQAARPGETYEQVINRLRMHA